MGRLSEQRRAARERAFAHDKRVVGRLEGSPCGHHQACAPQLQDPVREGHEKTAEHGDHQKPPLHDRDIDLLSAYGHERDEQGTGDDGEQPRQQGLGAVVEQEHEVEREDDAEHEERRLDLLGETPCRVLRRLKRRAFVIAIGVLSREDEQADAEQQIGKRENRLHGIGCECRQGEQQGAAHEGEACEAAIQGSTQAT